MVDDINASPLGKVGEMFYSEENNSVFGVQMIEEIKATAPKKE